MQTLATPSPGPDAAPGRWPLPALAVLLVLAAAFTLLLQGWIGPSTIYAPELAERRASLHEAILTNTPPERGWAAVGAASLNIRVGVVYLAEALHRWGGLELARSYWAIDSICLLVLLAALPLYLRRWLAPAWCLVGMLYLAAVLPLTYYLHAFQPWDRIQAVIWLLLLALVRDQRLLAAVLVLALSMLVKYDAILIAALYLMAHCRRGAWKPALLGACVLAVVAYLSLQALKWAFPAPAEPARFSLDVAFSLAQTNLRALIDLHLRHPVLLALALPVGLALVGLRQRPRFLQAAVLFGLLLTTIWATFTVYAEVRAQVPLLLLVLPAALLTLQAWFDGEATKRVPAQAARAG
jgi:hypothetical protein